jgi:hypothetical protein
MKRESETMPIIEKGTVQILRRAANGRLPPHLLDFDQPLPVSVAARVVLHQRKVLRHVEREVGLDRLTVSAAPGLIPRIWGTKLHTLATSMSHWRYA